MKYRIKEKFGSGFFVEVKRNLCLYLETGRAKSYRRGDYGMTELQKEELKVLWWINNG